MLVREIELTNELTLEINQNTSSGEHGQTVWDAGLALCHS